MRYGFYLPTRGELVNRAAIAALARAGEAAGELNPALWSTALWPAT